MESLYFLLTWQPRSIVCAQCCITATFSIKPHFPHSAVLLKVLRFQSLIDMEKTLDDSCCGLFSFISFPNFRIFCLSFSTAHKHVAFLLRTLPFSMSNVVCSSLTETIVLLISSIWSFPFSFSCLPGKFRTFVLSGGCYCLFANSIVFLQFPVVLLVCSTWSKLVFFFFLATARGSSLPTDSSATALGTFHWGLRSSASSPSPPASPSSLSHFLWYLLLFSFLRSFLTVHTDLSQVLPVARVPVFSGIHQGHSVFNLYHQSIFYF